MFIYGKQLQSWEAEICYYKITYKSNYSRSSLYPPPYQSRPRRKENDPEYFDYLTDEHKMIQQAARDFAQKEVAPIAEEFDHSGDFPLKTIKMMGEMGFMGIEVPEEYGGAGMDTMSYVLALEEICKADASHGAIMSVNNSLYCYGILRFGTEEQKQQFLVPVASGREDRRLLADRADVRLRCRHDAQPGCAGWG